MPKKSIKKTIKKKIINRSNDDGIVTAKKTTKGYAQGKLRAVYYEVYVGGNLLNLERKESIELLNTSLTK